ncbi:MAG: hypothetical protein AB1696_00415 [Planctomycetota bacterium]
MAKRIVIIVYILIGLALGGLFVWVQVRRGAAGFEEYAERMDVLALIAAAQQEYQRAAARDEDRDGVGEYGTLEELCRPDGANNASWIERVSAERSSTQPTFDAQIKDWVMQRDGTMETRGYIYTIVLPDTVDGRERNWCVFAHPREFTQATSQTYFLEGKDIISAYFTVYEGYAGPGRAPSPEKVYEGKPFDSCVREYHLPSTPDDRSDRLDENKMRRAAARVRKSEGTLWIRCRMGESPGVGEQETTRGQK